MNQILLRVEFRLRERRPEALIHPEPRGYGVKLALAWGFVGIPLAWGIVQTLINALKAFQ